MFHIIEQIVYIILIVVIVCGVRRVACGFEVRRFSVNGKVCFETNPQQCKAASRALAEQSTYLHH